MFEVLISALFAQVRSKVDLQAPVGEFHCSESHLQHEVLVQADQVFDSSENGVKCVIDHVFSHLARVSNWNGVGVDSAEALLVDRFLTAWRLDLLFAMVAVKVVRNFIIGYKSRLKVMHVLAQFPLRCDVMIYVHRLAPSNLGQLSFNVEDESSEFTDVDRAAVG